MFLFIVSVLILFVVVGGTVLALGKKANGVRVSEFWKLFLGLILIGASSGMSSADWAVKIHKIGMLVVGSFLIIWFVRYSGRCNLNYL